MIPVVYTWDGEAMVPLPRFMPTCDKEFVVGERYQLDVHKPRSRDSHNHYFACLHDAWLNLPESVAREFLNESKFRKWALVEAGYYDETRFVFVSNEEALKFAGHCVGLDEYVFATVVGQVLALRRAKSQSMKAMGNREFQKSKEDVLDVVSKLIGVVPAELKKKAGLAA